MTRAQRFLLKVVPATFVVGTVFGFGISAGMASFKGSAVFRDIPAGHYADDAIGEMYSLGIIKGLDGTHFGPDVPITRGQVAILLQRLRNELKGISDTVSSSSSSKSSSSSSSSSSVSSSSSSSSSSSVSSISSSSVSLSDLGIRFGSNGYNVDKNVATGNVKITVARTGGAQGGGSVDYTFTGGTAVAGKDYVALSGTLTFQGAQTSQALTLQILNNTSVSGTKTVNAILRNPTGSLKLAAPASVVVNINDPSNPTISSSSASVSSAASAATTIALSAAGYGVMENAGTMTFTAVRTGDTTGTQSVNYGTTNGTAPSSDYGATSGTLTFAPGDTSKTFTVTIVDNKVIDGNRTFNVALTNLTGTNVALGTASALVTINDDEALAMGSGSIKLNASSYSASATQGKVLITVNHVGGIGAVSVGYSTSNGTAQAGTDYSATSGTLNFAAGETSKTFLIPIAQKSITNSIAFSISLNSPLKAPLSDPSYATVTISN